MPEIKQFKPSTKEISKPDKPADIVDIESARKKKRLPEVVKNTSSVLADALELVQEGQLSDAEIDDLLSISEDEKTLLKVSSGLFERLRSQDKENDRLRDLVKKLEQERDSK